MHGLVEYHLRGMALGSPNSENYAVSVSKMENVLFHVINGKYGALS